jgi:hypothetical protein
MKVHHGTVMAHWGTMEAHYGVMESLNKQQFSMFSRLLNTAVIKNLIYSSAGTTNLPWSLKMAK